MTQSPTLLVLMFSAMAAGLAACDRQDGDQKADAPAASTTTPAPKTSSSGDFDPDDVVGDDEPGPDRANQEPAPGLSLPPIGPQRYVGVWAARPNLCRTGGWRFRPDGLVTAGETSCTFSNVTERAGGFDIAGSCLQDGARKPASMRLTFAESAGGMMVEGAPFQPTGLVWCWPEETE